MPGGGREDDRPHQGGAIFTRRTDPDVPADHPDWYGCLYRRKTAFRISLVDDYGVIVDRKLVRLSGRYVALAQNLGCGGCASDLGDRLVVRDLATGHVVSVGARDGFGDVLDVVLTPHRSAAFFYLKGGVVQVRVTTRRGSRIIDQGRAIGSPDQEPAFDSLELGSDGRSVTYRKDGARRMAPLP